MAYIGVMEANHEIQVLPIEIANQIAAGEVVERPASVIKELLENAIDAGGDRLEIGVTSAGRKLITVTDNGRGMNRSDALLSIARHATSKIRDVGDIDAIRTLGFRGEALAAISSVSRFRLTTCRLGETVGTELLVHGGKVEDVRDCGVPVGTRVEVRDLFYNVPARRKFLRGDQTELGHVRDVFLTHALAAPARAMRLRVDGKDLYRLAGASALIDRLRDLFSPDLVAHLLPLSWRGNGVGVTGFISDPLLHRADRNEQYLFVNGRSVSPALLRYAIGEGYKGVLPKERFPSVFLFLEIDPSEVDVNVHPTKKEIRFRRPMQVRDAVIAAIGVVLQHPGIGEEADAGIDDRSSGGRVPDAVRPALPVRDVLSIPDLPPLHAFRYPRRAASFPDLPLEGRPVDEVFAVPAEVAPGERGGGSEAEASGPAVEVGSDGVASDSSAPWAWCKVMGQVGGMYVALETEAGLVLMDPRAAHERVLYERMRSAVALRKVSSQPLLLPETMQLTPRDAENLRQHLDVFQAMGFGVSPFDGNSFMVDAVPSFFVDISACRLIQEMLADLDAGVRRVKHAVLESHLLEAACRAAVGLRKQLSLSEIENIVVDLARCEMPYTSPRGRPTLILMSLRELHRKFGREGTAP
ncbi:MAG: DNA mismatch repair endonuclease MutL [Kiritimatiellia bacterium]